ncbi:DEAD/DEAH box helicase [Paenibacillus sp. J22TS3]|uniref:DEAD/DEAH box helicase n=1 Tax=Paenibacillus sp. J22TS3 TaxID=2807192 RepID=UPI001B03AC4C|nr:helicase-related protein [Paenibacillus sp. J22TS3]GIP21765.1 hypothetical protein J22TS3_20400 [Paenibacillus sp. J22TS3]
MKADLYAVRRKEQWASVVTVDLGTDLVWWAQQTGAEADRLVLLGADIPLGRAIHVRDEAQLNSRMDSFELTDWFAWLDRLCARLWGRKSNEGDQKRAGGKKQEIEQRQQLKRGQMGELRGRQGEGRALFRPQWLWIREQGYSPYVAELLASRGQEGAELRVLVEAAAELTRLLQGRSLLLPELKQLLESRLPELAGGWASAAQLAQLLGGVVFTAGVAPAVLGRPLRRALPPRCRRCGSAVLAKAPCASCGRQDCAYCEACLTLGRSRECALLVRGAPVLAAAKHEAEAAAPTGDRLDRWGLSPAQRGAAEAALQFLASQPSGGGGKKWRWPNIRPSQPFGAAPADGARQAGKRRPDEGPPHLAADGFAGADGRTGKQPAGEALSHLPASGFAGASGRTREWQPAGAPSQPPLADLPGAAQRMGKRGPTGGPPRFLLWAVTGAGKTEMIFPLLEHVLQRGGRALVATPRRDVVLELAPRIAKVFPDNPPVVLYGGSSQRWENARLVLATTHQLLRYHQAFDLVIIDELDAFPYHNDPMLAYAAENCCRLDGRFILLSATPPKQLQRAATSGRMPHAKVPARFHGHPLPVPKRIVMEPVERCLARRRLPLSLLKELKGSVERGAQIFVFVSRIRHIEPLVRLVRSLLGSKVPVQGTSSQDEGRSEKVLSFRSGEIRVLITTTILERGVTVPRSDVYILDADSGLFDEASLVQMAGRAGRSKDDPAGKVLFASREWTASQRGAIRQIRGMNRLASRSGYLCSQGKVGER